MKEQDSWYQKTDETGWNSNTSVLSEVFDTLKRLYGREPLLPKGTTHSGETEYEAEVRWLATEADPVELFDAIEQQWHELAPESARAFQQAINEAFEDESCPWRLSDGCFFKVDSEFLEQHVIAKAHELIGTEGFRGAQDEFLEARSELTGGEPEDAIHKACKSFESVLKVVTGVDEANANVLVRKLSTSGHLADLPEKARNAIVEQVLMRASRQCATSSADMAKGHRSAKCTGTTPRLPCTLPPPSTRFSSNDTWRCSRRNRSRRQHPRSTTTFRSDHQSEGTAQPNAVRACRHSTVRVRRRMRVTVSSRVRRPSSPRHGRGARRARSDQPRRSWLEPASPR